MFPVIFNFAGITITSYGVMLSIAFIAGIILAQRRGIRYGVSKNTIGDISFLILIGALLGSRAFFVFTHLDDFGGEWWRALHVWDGGLTFYGGLILAFILSAIWIKIKKLSFGKLADIVIPSVALGIGLARIGCFLNGCCFGRPSNFGIIFPPDSFPAWELGVGVRVHPTQIYSSLIGFCIFGLLLILEKKKRFTGELLLWFFLPYGLSRFLIDFIRYYPAPTYLFLNLTYNQIISIGIFVLSVITLYLRRRSI